MRANIFLIMTLLITLSCTQKSSAKPTNRGSFGKAVTVITETITPADLQKYAKVVGKLEGITDVTLLSEVSGKITSINKKLGDWVNVGESLGSVDNSDYQHKFDQASASLLAAEASLETASYNMEAAENLFREKRISEMEYVNNRASFMNAQAAVEGARANVRIASRNLENSNFIAPVSGYVTEFYPKIGEVISSGKIIASIVDHSRLILRSGVSESDVSSIKKGNSVLVSYNGREYKGKLAGFGIKPVSGGTTYPVEITLDNPDKNLLPGMIVEARILSVTYHDVIFISYDYLEEKYSQMYLYVVNNEKKAELRKVKTGEKVGKDIIITDGLESGEKVVIDGSESLEDGMLVEEKNLTQTEKAKIISDSSSAKKSKEKRE